jgi:hypothetical protein
MDAPGTSMLMSSNWYIESRWRVCLGICLRRGGGGCLLSREYYCWCTVSSFTHFSHYIRELAGSSPSCSNKKGDCSLHKKLMMAVKDYRICLFVLQHTSEGTAKSRPASSPNHHLNLSARRRGTVFAVVSWTVRRAS